MHYRSSVLSGFCFSVDANILGWVWKSCGLLPSRGAGSNSETTQAVLDHRGPTERLKDLRGGQISECLDILRDT